MDEKRGYLRLWKPPYGLCMEDISDYLGDRLETTDPKWNAHHRTSKGGRVMEWIRLDPPISCVEHNDNKDVMAR